MFLGVVGWLLWSSGWTLVIGKSLLNHGHPIGEVVHGTADLAEEAKEFGESDGFIRAGLPQDVRAFALAGDHQSLCGQLPDGVPRGHDGDAVSGGEFGKGGELVTRLVRAVGDGVA